MSPYSWKIVLNCSVKMVFASCTVFNDILSFFYVQKHMNIVAVADFVAYFCYCYIDFS